VPARPPGEAGAAVLRGEPSLRNQDAVKSVMSCPFEQVLL
jgi:hypothetical protein